MKNILSKTKTGTIKIEIDDEDWNGVTVGKDDVVQIQGEVDKSWTANRPKSKLTSSKKFRLRNNNLFYTLQCEGYFLLFVTMLAINAVRINNINPKPIIITAGDDFVSLRKCQFAAKIPK